MRPFIQSIRMLPNGASTAYEIRATVEQIENTPIAESKTFRHPFPFHVNWSFKLFVKSLTVRLKGACVCVGGVLKINVAQHGLGYQ